MEAYVTEEQQLEAIKNWFKKYGNSLLWVITFVLLTISGVRYWFHHQNVINMQASDLYFTMLTGFEQHDASTMKTQGELLTKQYPKSPYASFATFLLAKEAISENKLDEAQTYLQWVIDNSRDSDLSALARIRLIKLLYSQNKLEEAKALVNEKKADGFLTLMAELNGDILVKQKDLKGAAKAYEQALVSAPEEGMHGPLLKMKLEDLGIDPQTLVEGQAKPDEAKKL